MKKPTTERFSLQELEATQQRLRYFEQKKAKFGNAPAALETWIQIYSERLQKLEKAAAKAAATSKPGAQA